MISQKKKRDEEVRAYERRLHALEMSALGSKDFKSFKKTLEKYTAHERSFFGRKS